MNKLTAQPSVFHRTKFGVVFTLFVLIANIRQARTWVHCAEEEIKYELSVI